MLNLTNSLVSKLEPTDKEQTISDSKITGLKVRVGVSGAKNFYLFYKIAGKQRKYRIGKFGDIGVPAARDIAQKLKARIALGEDVQTTRVDERMANKQEAGSVLRTFLDEYYYPWCEAHQKVPTRTKQILEHNFKQFMGSRMGSITKASLDNWSSQKLAKGIKPSTINRASTSFKAVLNKAVEWQIIDTNPIAGKKRLKVDKKGVVRYLSEAEETRLLEALESSESDYIKLLIPILLNTGARPAEALSLTWGNINLKNRQITLQAAFTKTGQTRVIPINDDLLEILNAQESKSGYLFPNVKGTGPITTVQKSWGTLRKKAKLENFRLYDCRHTFASNLVMRGIDLYTVSTYLGHSSTEMTTIYAHHSPKHLLDSINVLCNQK